ncbi:MAG: pantoate--beta-alanine ligase [Actinomycetota bacterium]|nr:pantoate--beta-alanine ligase [Actinomycetota bacterium]
MKVIKSIAELKTALKEERNQGRSIGFVATMGYFHEGHLSLMREAELENDIVVVSIFVNPTQFGPNEDLDSYPRDLKKDIELAESVGVDYLFTPAADEIYPPGFSTYVDIGPLASLLCGASRPNHFKGVLTVVLKLFGIVGPDGAYFGKKDYQQLTLIKKMANELNLATEVIALEIVREEDGLAMSSRNKYLNGDERRAAASLSRALMAAKRAAERGERDPKRLIEMAKSIIEKEELIDLEYITICDNISLEPKNDATGGALMALAARIGKARLIDNIEIL